MQETLACSGCTHRLHQQSVKAGSFKGEPSPPTDEEDHQSFSRCTHITFPVDSQTPTQPTTNAMAYAGELCGSKLRSKLGGVLNESATSHSPALLSSNQSFAKRQLEKMGWQEGTGLGKRRDGQVDHIKIKQRQDEMGLGKEKELARDIADVWWKDSVGGTLARLQKKKSAEKDKKRKSKDKRKSKRDKLSNDTVKVFTDDELFAATGGARFGMRAQRRAEGKWKRTESGSELTELEKKALKSMEWNGRGSAEVKLSRENSVVENDASVKESAQCGVLKEGKRKRKEADNDDDDEQSNSIDALPSTTQEDNEVVSEDMRRLKKKRRKEAKKSIKAHKVSPPPSEEDALIEDAVSKKKSKKEKKSKKSSKK